MGSARFVVEAEGKNAREAFNSSVEEHQYNYGHAGYTGTIAEKDSFKIISLPEGMNAEEYAEELLDTCDKRIDDKWGPAGCLVIEEGKRYLFFGWASE